MTATNTSADTTQHDASHPSVALLGLGTMGAGMAKCVLASGLELRVWNRTRDKTDPLAELGATVADSPAEAARGADLVVTMLFDHESVAAVIRDAAEGLTEDTIWVQTSTVGARGADAFARLADELGVTYVDAPVVGTKKPAEDGTLVVLASGPDTTQAITQPFFDSIGSRTLWVGAAGRASRLKLVVNAWILAVLEGVAESVNLAQALDLDPGLFLETIRGGALDAPYVGVKATAMIGHDFTPSFTVDGVSKDARLIGEAAEAAGVQMPITAIARDFLTQVGEEHGSDDMAATILADRTQRR